MTSSWPARLSETAQLKRWFLSKPTSPRRMDLDSDRHESALNMSKSTKQVKVMVVSRRVTCPSSSISCVYTIMVPNMMMKADCATRISRLRVSTASLRFRGGRFMTSLSTASTPSDCAGGPSMMISVGEKKEKTSG